VFSILISSSKAS